MRITIALVCLWALLRLSAGEAGGLALDPENSHYLNYHGKPILLVGSGEHYGAVLNADFDYVKYLGTLKRDGLNLTRVFSGVYCESDKSFGIAGNTLAPARGKFLSPWARSAEAGYKGGGNKFDLDKWDEAYFARLKDFLTQAGQAGVFVEFTLFCPFYDEDQWELSPMNSANNINHTPQSKRTEVYSLAHGPLSALQDKLVRKFAAELNGFDNFYFEICNEPYFGGVTLKWQRFISDTLTSAEQDLPHKHLIAQNIANKKAQIRNDNPSVRIFNFHYAAPPETVAMNYALNRVIADDETGFAGISDYTYRREAWEFILAGGGIFEHLDYSFTVGHEAGDFEIPAKQPGGGGAKLRQQLKTLKDFMSGFELSKLRPDTLAVGSVVPAGAARCISDPGKAYGIYIHGNKQTVLTLALPRGKYMCEWIDTLDGKKTTRHAEVKIDSISLEVPAYENDIALRIVREE